MTGLIGVRDLRFDNVPFGRTQFAPTLWTKSVTVGAQSLRPPIDWDRQTIIFKEKVKSKK
ncbi:MAG: hypothetical protein EWV80_03910 [Microcystis aeruginosa Ma_QC_B_20070730_S2]|uniref:Uncharacterized protein n=1 Tax=Microcystis aeruginosa Ma_QC_B_20070730_S2 TaxID=2486256 RepID=A0A552E597_MICAE|nr:MAG: hypothetical protein EWV80_03910 [Microcystis aeruginosa Ma_QC_B_20070730_S2]